MGFSGPAGPQGAQGSSGILSMHVFNGFAGNAVVLDPNDYSFIGPTTNVTVNAGQRVTGAATIALGKQSPGNVQAALGLCYQTAVPLGVITNFVGGAYVQSTIIGGTTNVQHSASASVSLPVAQYNVGFCGRGSVTFDSNDYVNGWVFVSQ